MALKIKNAFVTGGAQGIGKGIAEALLSAGARVVFADIDTNLGPAAEKELVEKFGKDKVKFVQLDVANEAQFEAAFKQAVDFLGYVDLMVNNAGLLNESKWQSMIQINYAGYVKGTLLAMEHLRKDKGGKGGRIINVCSETGLQDFVFLPVYSGTKHAVRAFTSSLAIAPDVKDLGLEYGLLCPGMVDTNMVHSIDETKMRHLQLIDQSAASENLSSVDHIVEGFMRLLQLEDMNRAIMEVQAKEWNYVKMEKVNLGETWPVSK